MDSSKNVRLNRSSSTRREKKEWFVTNEEETSIKDADIVLCGTSEEQIKMLNQIGIYTHKVAVNQSEDNVSRSLPPDEYVEQLSAAKANKVAQILSEKNEEYDIIIACESVIVLGDELIGKPQNPDDAFAILSRLNNRQHSVISGITLIHKSQRTETFRVETTIRFGDIPPEMFRSYIDSGECFGRNGAYNIHGKAAAFIKSVDGDFCNAVGFPVHDLILKIRELLLVPSSAVVERQPTTPSAAARPIPLPRTIFPAPLNRVTVPVESEEESQKNIQGNIDALTPATSRAETKDPRPIPLPRTIFPAQMNLVTVASESEEENKENLSRQSFSNESLIEFEANLSGVDKEVEKQMIAAAVEKVVEQPVDADKEEPSAAVEKEVEQRTEAARHQHQAASRLSHIRTRRTMLQQSPASSFSAQQLPPKDEYMSTFYRSTGRPGLADLRRIGIEPQINRNQTPQHDYKYSPQDDWG